MKRLLVMGDIHGNYQRFQSVWNAVKFTPGEDEIIFLGDYTDRGHENAQVMEWVLAHRHDAGMTFLCGNHEVMYYDAFRSQPGNENDGMSYSPNWGNPRELWLDNGGTETMRDVWRSSRSSDLNREWLQFIAEMPRSVQRSYQGSVYFFAHGGINPRRPLAEQKEDDLVWSREVACSPETYEGEAVLIFGHTPVQMLGYAPVPQILCHRHVILMDTGSFWPDGHISCMDLLTYKIWQSEDSFSAGQQDDRKK